MYIVYWMEDNRSSARMFDELKATLDFMESLRKNTKHSFVTMCSENPNSVGKPGVDEVGPDYNWTKRRGTMKK